MHLTPNKYFLSGVVDCMKIVMEKLLFGRQATNMKIVHGEALRPPEQRVDETNSRFRLQTRFGASEHVVLLISLALRNNRGTMFWQSLIHSMPLHYRAKLDITSASLPAQACVGG